LSAISGCTYFWVIELRVLTSVAGGAFMPVPMVAIALLPPRLLLDVHGPHVRIVENVGVGNLFDPAVFLLDDGRCAVAEPRGRHDRADLGQFLVALVVPALLRFLLELLALGRLPRGPGDEVMHAVEVGVLAALFGDAALARDLHHLLEGPVLGPLK